MHLAARFSVLALLPTLCVGLFFNLGGGGGGGGCCCPQPACAPAASSCGCGGASSGYGSYNGANVFSAAPAYRPAPAVSSISVPAYSAGYASAPARGFVPAPAYTPQVAPAYASQFAQSAPYSAPVPSYSAPTLSSAPASGYSAFAPAYSAGPAPEYADNEQVTSTQVPVAASSYSSPSADEEFRDATPIPVQADGDPFNIASGTKIEEIPTDEDSAKQVTVQPDNNLTPAPEPSPPVPLAELNLTNDPECNSEDLKVIIKENMSEDLNTSKRLVQLAAEAKFGGRFDVICSSSDFSYVTNTELFCQETHERVSCYAYRQL